MASSSAHVATDRPARYAKQLVSHLTRRATGEWDDAVGDGWLQFDGGRATLHATEGALDLHVVGDDLARLEDVVGRHLVRFGARDELVVRWTHGDGTVGSEQRNDADSAEE
jgi:hypothetical protein